ncbi:MAG: hypothetical protein Q8N39_06475 [Pelolinea sp.]|nr:hypothetical protein [Pelolinea sp.]
MNNSKKKDILIIRLIIKSISLFILLNFLFILVKDIPYGSISLYNSVFPGRERLPFGETPSESFNLTIFNLDAMLSSHKISADKKTEYDYRIIIIGDSSIWGFLQKPENTLVGLLDKNIDFQCDSKNIEVFNLGYPSLSVLKDLVILDKVKSYHPDLVIWFITLESLVSEEQLNTPLIKNNSLILNKVINNYQLTYPKANIDLLDYTIIGQKRNLADNIRLQLYGALWAGSGIDQAFPEEYTPAQRDFESDYSYKNFEDNQIQKDDLAISVILKTVSGFPELDFILINEPILISSGKNSDIRYNFYYPRWAYDDYRNIVKSVFEQSAIKYYDFWDLVPESEFTNSAIHLSTIGEEILAAKTEAQIKNHCESLGKE